MAGLSQATNQPISLQALESYLWGAATLLRGLVDAGDYKQFVFPLLFYKRLSDVWDEDFAQALEETGDATYAIAMANDRFIIPDGAHWKDVRVVAKDVGKAIQNAMRAIEAANPGRLDGIFGDAPWTNKERLPDYTLKNLLEHFSGVVLSLANVPEDELGNAYEYLIKKFADDSGHTAQEFYTNRTVVHLMVQMLDPQPGETIYDPTCGTGGMLISALVEVKRRGEHRTLKLYGQERNHMTASIARMNLVLHGVEDYQIARGDTLERPAFTERDQLRTFSVVLANPPYSIKQWSREAFQSDAWGRNFLGTPPQGRADYTFFQHILKSLDPKTGRCAILFPHGVLFRKEEAEMRKKLVEADLVECVLGLGANLFYNSSMEACVVVCRTNKPAERRGKVLFIDAANEVARMQAQSFLKPEHQQRVLSTYQTYSNEPGFAKVISLEEIAAQNYSLSIRLYVQRKAKQSSSQNSITQTSVWAEREETGRAFWQQMDAIIEMLDELVMEEDNHD
ncbi:SAM-dependent DNA methyltransferase [Trichocoleus sp. FACHB-832]|uniref:type I restriction-modification system subunit M n=1 Tax=Trichocoleus sp. FACHB-832 TaxID=2692875 RepID=UPI001688AA84|nr:class I SAM-dependent DNA methyltransferase [Trichocoleus sp. FACHB-832]MBD1906447.1 SAM-dependent DNA methyltransferase [Trichocoleus sp. FACHB-832]